MLKPLLPAFCGLLLLAGCQASQTPEPAQTTTPPTASTTPAAPESTHPDEHDASTSTATEPAQEHTAMATAEQWQCGDHHVTITISKDGETLTLAHADGELVLPHEVSASGARYADDKGNEFWNKGNESMLTFAGHEEQLCHKTPPAP
ncbi:MAG: MliC family protein [Xanthomonadaceae bacterium]|jgi:membrane-bound inhibitor of C-type lysozyme|nr:MliC family protein [Xanthomonadaceae bacterium]